MVSKKKVLLVNDFEHGGGAEGVFQLTAKLLERQYEVYTYTAYKGFKDTGSNPIEYIYSRKHFNNIKQLILEKKIDIVHIHNFRWITPSVFMVKRWLKKHAKGRDVKFVLTAHDYLLACPNVAYGYYEKGKFVRYAADKVLGSFLFKQMDQHGWKFSWLKKMQWCLAFSVLRLQNEIDQVISPSVFLKDVLQLNDPKMQIAVIRNPMDIDNNIKVDTKINSGQRIRLVYFGRVASEKGTDVLLEMLSAIKNEITFSLDIFGTGPMADNISLMIEGFGLSDYVVYHGFRPFNEVQAQLLDFDAFIMSSIWYENAPLSIVEAAMAGLKLIVPNMGGMKEMAELCGNEYLYEIGNATSLKEALNNLNETYKKMEKNNIQKCFSEETYVECITAIYK